VGIRNALNQNQLFQQEFAARQGLGQAAQAAIGPNGQLDPNAYFQQLAKNKSTAFMAMKGYQEGLATQRAQNENSLSTLGLAQKKLDFESQGLLPLINNPNVTKKDIHGAIANVVVNSMDDTGKPLVSAADAMNYISARRDQQGNIISPGLDDLP